MSNPTSQINSDPIDQGAAFHAQVRKIMRYVRRMAVEPRFIDDETGQVRWRAILADCYRHFHLDPANPRHEAQVVQAVELVQDEHEE